MANWTHRNWLLLLLGVSLLLTGCSQTDLSDYKPAKEHAAAPEVPLIDSPGSLVNIADRVATEAADAPLEPSRVADTDQDLPPISALVPVNAVDGANVGALMSVPATDIVAARADKPDNESSAVPAEPRKIEVLVKDKLFRAEPKTGAVRVSFDDIDLLKVLNMEPVVENAPDLMPDWLRGLDGKTIRLRGFMYPTFDTEGIEHFVLARDNQICCFGRDPKIYDLVQINMKEGKSTNYIPWTRAFDVIGKFRIDMQFEDGKPLGLYVIDDASVIDR